MAQTKNGEEYLAECKIDINDKSKYPQFDRNFWRDGYPEQALRDKIAKNRAYNVLRSAWDPETSSVKYEVLVNVHETTTKVVTKEEICKMFSWSDFKFTTPVSKVRSKMVKPKDIDKFCVIRVVPKTA